jgi:hypothetical protein
MAEAIGNYLEPKVRYAKPYKNFLDKLMESIAIIFGVKDFASRTETFDYFPWIKIPKNDLDFI